MQRLATLIAGGATSILFSEAVISAATRRIRSDQGHVRRKMQTLKLKEEKLKRHLAALLVSLTCYLNIK